MAMMKFMKKGGNNIFAWTEVRNRKDGMEGWQ